MKLKFKQKKNFKLFKDCLEGDVIIDRGYLYIKTKQIETKYHQIINAVLLESGTFAYIPCDARVEISKDLF